MKMILPAFLLGIALAWTATAADVSGKWTGTFTPENGDGGAAYVVLTQNGSTLTGTGGPSAEQQWPGLQGTISGSKVSFQVKDPEDGTVYKCELTLDGDHLKGDVTFTPAGGEAAKGKLDLTRVAR